MKTYCKKNKCKWRIDCNNGKAICFVQNCPYEKEVEELPTIKFARGKNGNL